MSALISRVSTASSVSSVASSLLRIAAFLLALTVLVATPGFAGAESNRAGSNSDAIAIEQVVAQAVADLDLVWEVVFADYDLAYIAPNVLLYDGDIDTPCGTQFAGDGYGMYCGADATVYLDAIILTHIANEQGIFATAIAIADTWGYALQHQLGEVASDAMLDVQATCLAGTWAWYVWDAGLASDDDLVAAFDFYLALNDGEVLAEVFFFGFETDSVVNCFADVA